MTRPRKQEPPRSKARMPYGTSIGKAWLIRRCKLSGLANVPVAVVATVRRGLFKALSRWVQDSDRSIVKPQDEMEFMEWTCERCPYKGRCFDERLQDVSARNMERFVGTVDYRKKKADAKSEAVRQRKSSNESSGA